MFHGNWANLYGVTRGGWSIHRLHFAWANPSLGPIRLGCPFGGDPIKIKIRRYWSAPVEIKTSTTCRIPVRPFD
jgi:hypothetical protein